MDSLSKTLPGTSGRMKFLPLGFALLLTQCAAPTPPAAPNAAGVAPDFRLQEVSGKAVALRELRGKVVYLDFWYSGCRPCLAEAPASSKLKRAFLGRDVVFLYVSTDTNINQWRQTIDKFALAGPNSVHLFDPEGWHAARAYQVQGFPTYLLISRDGRILSRNAPRPSEGAKTVAALEQALAAEI